MSADRLMYRFPREFAGKNSLGQSAFECEVLFARRHAIKSGSDVFYVSGDLMSQIKDYLGKDSVEKIGVQNYKELIVCGINDLLAQKELNDVSVEVEAMQSVEESSLFYQVKLAKKT